MLKAVQEAAYFPTIKWKKGERDALASCPPASRRLLIPNIIFPAAGEYDPEKGRPLTPTEHVRLFGEQLSTALGRLPAFVDALLVDDAQHAAGLSSHPLIELVERARLRQATAFPVTSLDRTAPYQQAVARFVEREARLPIGVKISAADFEARSLQRDLAQLLRNLGVEAGRVLINIDFGGALPTNSRDIVGFAELMEERLNEFPRLHEWLQIVISMTSFPAEPKMKAGETKEFARFDWLAFQKLVENRRLLRVPAYGDYAVDASPYKRVVGKVTPSAQLRHTSSASYTIVKGNQAKKPIGYGEIYPVAARLAALDGFPRGVRSEGDDFVSALAARSVGHSGASKWRWAATDHHFALVTQDVAALTGVPVENPTSAPSDADQLALFQHD